MPDFDHLFEAAIAEWPERLDLKVIESGPVYFVEGLARLQEKLAAQWIGKPSGVLMRNMHWAISAVANRAFEKREPVIVRDLSKDAIRAKFEADLTSILYRPLNWKPAEIDAIKQYLAA
ncbi:MAG: hypothetical protein A4S14_00625 [Proteobacteria bacterium SG_bin9]|nr:MAG: hypothetical protein A4S14_00625 [Proteobacteria bacterium SG_bin9]